MLFPSFQQSSGEFQTASYGRVQFGVHSTLSWREEGSCQDYGEFKTTGLRGWDVLQVRLLPVLGRLVSHMAPSQIALHTVYDVIHRFTGLGRPIDNHMWYKCPLFSACLFQHAVEIVSANFLKCHQSSSSQSTTSHLVQVFWHKRCILALKIPPDDKKFQEKHTGPDFCRWHVVFLAH